MVSTRMKRQRRGEHARMKRQRRGEHADRVEGARKVRKDGIRRCALHVRAERRGELALEPPHTFPPGSHEHTATQEAKRTTPRPEPGPRGRHVPDERRRIGSAAVDAADKVALHVRDRNLLGCGQRGQDSVGVLAFLWGEGRRGTVVSTRVRAARAGKTRSVCWRTSFSCQSEAIRGNQRQSEAITSVGLQAYVEQLPFGWQARAVQECAEGPGRTRALEVQRVPVGRGDGAPW